LKILIAGLGSIGRRHLRNLVAMGQEDILLYRTHQSTLPDEELAPFPVETDLGAALAQFRQPVRGVTSCSKSLWPPAMTSGLKL